MIEKDRFIELLDKFIDRSVRYEDDAKIRNDRDDINYYKGQKNVIEELKDMAKNWK